MNTETDQLAQWIEQACVTEVVSPKPGNVTPGCEFTDATVDDFVYSARLIAPILAETKDYGVGRSIYRAVMSTQKAVGHNTNLGIVLLLAPLAAVPHATTLKHGIADVLQSLTIEDADWAYRAIREAAPGGLGGADEQDVSDAPTETLIDCMRRAQDRDLIARQYVTEFRDILDVGLSLLIQSKCLVPEPDRVAWTALKLLSRQGDTLIARKCGPDMSAFVRSKASAVFNAGWPRTGIGRQAWLEFDAFLRADGNRRNPGTTADMIAAIVFAGLRSGDYAANTDLLSPYARQEPL